MAIGTLRKKKLFSATILFLDPADLYHRRPDLVVYQPEPPERGKEVPADCRTRRY